MPLKFTGTSFLIWFCVHIYLSSFCHTTDILCGRGGLTNHHKGNKRFRDIVALHRPDYVRAPKIQKPSVARVIVRAIRNGDPPGRFLKKDEKTGKWYDIGDKRAAEKTSQALREKTNDERDPSVTSPFTSPTAFLPATTASLPAAMVGTAPVSPSPVAAKSDENKTETNGEKAYVASSEVISGQPNKKGHDSEGNGNSEHKDETDKSSGLKVGVNGERENNSHKGNEGDDKNIPETVEV